LKSALEDGPQVTDQRRVGDDSDTNAESEASIIPKGRTCSDDEDAYCKVNTTVVLLTPRKNVLCVS
jgi:hypothetical protein